MKQKKTKYALFLKKIVFISSSCVMTFLGSLVLPLLFSGPLMAQVGMKEDRVHKLTCKKLDYLLGYTPGFNQGMLPDIAVICNRSALLCHAQRLVFQEKKNNPLRKEVEQWLSKELRGELDLCEVTIRHFNPSLLTVRVP